MNVLCRPTTRCFGTVDFQGNSVWYNCQVSYLVFPRNSFLTFFIVCLFYIIFSLLKCKVKRVEFELKITIPRIGILSSNKLPTVVPLVVLFNMSRNQRDCIQTAEEVGTKKGFQQLQSSNPISHDSWPLLPQIFFHSLRFLKIK